MRNIASFHILLGFILIIIISPCFSKESKAARSESKSIQAVSELADTASRLYAVVVDSNTLEHQEWGQVVEALKKKYNAKVFVAHYPEVSTVRKALNEYMPWYVCFIAQPEQATREMITAAAHTMTWLDDDPYEDAIWAVLTGFVAEDAIRIIDSEPLVVRKELSAHNWDGWLDWLEAGVSFQGDGNNYVKNSGGVIQQLEVPKERLPEIVEVLNRDDCDIITISGHATEHAFYLGKLNASNNYITHNKKGDVYGIDTQGKIHHVNAKKPKIFYAPGSCDIGHIDGPSCLSLAWIHNGVNAFWGHMYTQGRHCHAYHITEYFMALQDRYTFAEASYANWLALRFSVDEQLELHLCCDEGGKGTVLYGDPAWEARVKHTTVPAYTQDLNIEHLSDGLIELTVSVTLNREWLTWGQPGIIRPVILLPFRIKEARIKYTDLDNVGVADNFIVLDLDTNSIGESGLPVGTKKSVVLYAQELKVWPFLSDDEVVTRVREKKLDNISRRIDFLTDATVDPNERIKKATMRDMFRTPDISEASDEEKAELLNKAIDYGVSVFHELLDEHSTSFVTPSTKQVIDRVQPVKKNRALREAVKKKDVEQIKLLITEGADVNAKYPGGETALQLAAEAGITESAKLLLEAGSDINAQNDYGQTALHLAAKWADGDMVELFLNKDADVNVKDEGFGFTALHYAAQLGNRNAAELLIARDADINAKDKQDRTPLYIAVNHDYRVAELLINKGADSGIRTESSQTLLQLAQERKQAESNVPDVVFDGKPDSLFGSPIACGDVDGDGHDDIFIGAVREDNSKGRVYLFYCGPDMDTTADLILEGQNEGERFGSGIVCGDINNDGYEDIIIAASGYNERRGRVYLYWGSDRHSMDADPDKIFVEEESKASLFGENSPVVFDIDNDGYKDIILGACYNQDDRLGRVYLYYGNTKELMDTSHDLVFTAGDPSDHYTFGLRIACGNIDNDGYGDIVIGSQSYPYSKRKVRAHLYYGGSRSNMNAEADVIFEVNTEGNSLYGRDIVCIDQNRDNYDDIVLGALGYNMKQGRAFLFHGNSKQGLDTNPDMILNGEHRSCSFGHNVVYGDIDGDNVNDLIVGARDFRQGSGRVYAYSGHELADPDPKPSRIFTGENPKDYFGQGLACGDINNDGFDDLVIGAYAYKAGARQGRTYLYYGGPKKK
jgi:ankyrin repeat protein